MIKMFFEDIGSLDEYNFGLTTSLVSYPNLSVTIGASTTHTFLKALRFRLRFKKSFENLKTTLMGPPLSDKLKWITAKSLARIYEKYFSSFDVLHLNYCYSSYTGSATKVHVPRVLTFHDHPVINDYLVTEKKSISELNHLVNILSHMDIVTVPSHAFARLVEQRLNFRPVVIHHGVNTSLFNTSISKTHARKYLNIPSKRKVILWNSRMILQKDPKTLIDAMPKMVKEVPSILFLMIGRPGSDEHITKYQKYILRYARRKIKDAGIKPNVNFLIKYIPYRKLPIYYRSADVFVHTSRLESFGLVLAEAMACKLPVVATNASCCPEVVGEGGVFFEPGDSQDLAEKIIKILDDKSLRKKLGTKARNRILKNFTWRKAAREYLNLYLSVV